MKPAGLNGDLSLPQDERKSPAGSGVLELQAIYRVTVFVPRDALKALIGGIKHVYPLGDDYYDSVLWYVDDAREQFRPLQGSRPSRGSRGELHEEPVSMLVFSLPRNEALLEKVIESGVKAHHPWEAPGLFIDESWTLQPKVQT